MKEKKTKILLLSALAAMTLASCGGTPQVSSNPSNSSADPASAPASSEPVQESKSSQAPVDDSKPAEQSEDSVVISDDQPAQSIPEQPSSEEQELQDWVGQAFVGQYQGGFTGLIINEDKSTSWDTDKTHYPAILEVLDNGIYHIYSADTVPSDEKVDVYTDGTMAYLTHDAVEKDAFIVDKGAEYEAANAMAKKADGSLIFGSIMAGNKLKFFRAANGVFDFDIKVDVNYGASIEALGAIFDVTVGDVTATYRTTVAGNAAAGQYAIIEDYQIVITAYGGMEGDLVVARNQGEIVYVTLDGVAVDPELISEEDGAITIKGAERVLDQTDVSHMQWVYSATKYILDEASHTYESEDATSREDVFHVLDMNETQFTAEVGADGNLWATFTPSVSGFFNVNIITGTGDNDYYGSYDYIAIYRADADSYGSPYTYAEDYAYYYEDYYGYDTEEAAIENFLVTAGVTYVIKASNNDDIYNVLGDDDSEHEGESITIGYSYTAFDIVTYNGDNGALVIESYNGTFRSAILNGQPLDKATFVNNVLTAKATVMDFSNPANPQRTITTITITVDPATSTYVYESASETDSVFHVLTEEDSGNIYQTIVGEDGNLWAIFTPTSGGFVTVEETVTASTGGYYSNDGYIAIYDATAASYVTANALAKADGGSTVANSMGRIENFVVEAGKSYIIKAGAYADRDKDLGATGSTYAGNAEAISFTFSSVLTRTFAGDNGNLVLSTDEGEFVSASIGGSTISNVNFVENDDGTLTLSVIGAGTIDNTDPLDPIRNSTDTVYTLDPDQLTYEVAQTASSVHIFQEVTSNSAVITATVGEDGNLWAKFTAPSDGFLSVSELVAVADDRLSIFPTSAAPFTSYSSAIATADKAYSGGLESLEAVAVTAGTTYIIKAGYYSDASKAVTDTGSAHKGKTASIKVEFNTLVTATYTGDNGDLVVSSLGQTITSATLNGTAITGAKFDEDGNILVEGAATIDNADPLNPTSTSTNTTYVLDEASGSYTVSVDTHTANIFHEVTGSEVVTDVVGKDGNLWIKFTAPSEGEITVDELVACHTDNYIQIYASTANSFTSSNAAATADNGGTAAGSGKISNFVVHQGETYIIKAGAWADRDKLVTATNSSYAGKTESVSFTFDAYDEKVYTAEGQPDLKVVLKGDALQSVTLGGEAIEGAALKDGNIVVEGEIEVIEGACYQPVLTYVLDDENGTYAIQKDSIPYVESDAYSIEQGSPYGFTHDEENGTYTSSNAGVNSSNATMTITFDEDGYFFFDYDVVSEGTTTPWDYLTVTLNGVTVDGFTKVGGESGKTGRAMITVKAGDILVIKYVKDFGGESGRDSAIISGLSFLVQPSEEEEVPEENPIENPDPSNE